MGKRAARCAGTGAIIGTATTNSSGVATQPFAFTLPGNYTLVANVSQADSTQYGLSTASVSPVFVLDQTSMTLTQVRPARVCDPACQGVGPRRRACQGSRPRRRASHRQRRGRPPAVRSGARADAGAPAARAAAGHVRHAVRVVHG